MLYNEKIKNTNRKNAKYIWRLKNKVVPLHHQTKQVINLNN
jgi:hypothetical protein